MSWARASGCGMGCLPATSLGRGFAGVTLTSSRNMCSLRWLRDLLADVPAGRALQSLSSEGGSWGHLSGVGP